MRRHRDLLALGGYLLLTLAFTYPLIRQFTVAIPGDGFDGWQNYWNLWWVKIAILGRHSSPYFTDLLYAPTGVELLFHTLNAFNGFFTLPVQLAWALLPAYNVAVIFSFAAGGFGTYLLARQVLRGRRSYLAAFTAGAIFTLSPFHIAHLLGHLQMISLEWIPFFALYLVRLVSHAEHGPGRTRLESRSIWRLLARDALMAALFLILVALCDWYYVLYCLILAALALAWLIGRRALALLRVRRAIAGLDDVAGNGDRVAGPAAAAWPPAALLGALAGTGLVFAAALSPVLLPMLREASQSSFMVPDPAQSRALSADLLAFITPQEFHPIWGRWAAERAQAFTTTLAERQVFAGYAVLLLALVGLFGDRIRRRQISGGPLADARWPEIPERRGMRSFWLLTALAFALLALGPVLHIAGNAALLPGGGEISLPYGWLARTVPFLNISRSVSRFDVMVMLALGVLAAYGIQWLSYGGFGSGLALGALCLILFEFWPAPYPMTPPDTPGWYATLAADPRPGAVLNLPMNWDRPGYLLYQTVHAKPLTAAYISRDDPRTLVERAPVLQHFRHLGPDIVDLDVARQGRQVLSDLGVRWVVLDRYKMPGAKEREYNETTARSIFGAQPPVYRDQRLTVYEVQAPDEGSPYPVLGAGWQPFDGERHSRAFDGRATVLVQAPGPGHADLYVTLAPGSAPLAAQRDDEAGDMQEYRLPVELQSGSNTITLEAAQAGEHVVVSRVAVAPPNR